MPHGTKRPLDMNLSLQSGGGSALEEATFKPGTNPQPQRRESLLPAGKEGEVSDMARQEAGDCCPPLPTLKMCPVGKVPKVRKAKRDSPSALCQWREHRPVFLSLIHTHTRCA